MIKITNASVPITPTSFKPLLLVGSLILLVGSFLQFEWPIESISKESVFSLTNSLYLFFVFILLRICRYKISSEGVVFKIGSFKVFNSCWSAYELLEKTESQMLIKNAKANVESWTKYITISLKDIGQNNFDQITVYLEKQTSKA